MQFGPVSIRLGSVLARGLQRPKLRSDLKISKQTFAGEVSYVTRIFNTPYNYTWLRSEQLFELRYTPILALAMFILALVIVRRPRVQVVPPAAQISLCAGIGALGFGAMRLVLGTLYAKNLAWSSSWEEIIEFLSMIFIAYVLYQFRRRFALRNDAVPA